MLGAGTHARRIKDITHGRLDLIDGPWGSMPVNDGVASTRGVELEARLPWRDHVYPDLRRGARCWR
jgi:hypothetical protein